MTLRALCARLRVVIQHPVKSIRRLVRSEEQVEIQKRLRQVFETLVRFCHEIYVDPDQIPELDVYPFDPDNLASPALHFFQPWSTTQLAKYEKNLELDGSGTRLAYLERVIQAMHVAALHAHRPHDMDEFESMVTRLVWELETCPRKETKNNSHPLSRITKWKIFPGIKMHWWFDTVDRDGCTEPTWHCYHSWTISKDIPHVKVLMVVAAPTHPDLLFKAELLTIVCIMVSRMKKRSLKKHAVVPVMLFSLSGPKHGRILTAHYDGKRIVVHRSPAYRFFPDDSMSLQLFVRYLASDVKPFGKTHL
ncbi:hypothetical protein N7492_000669 [Penicillium capsulatum]|uniref:Uncharacterized protein n=1 Tax=Penicillium capsulatum TaxID=69766 RepID=A0A9W9LYZ3_9EURO|nr:hypothetical protein N7492_000669 [Penicillium capsulatum]KAJ6130272.1 hypothetical protein N7512_003052 [Penicillium capsulatum]